MVHSFTNRTILLLLILAVTSTFALQANDTTTCFGCDHGMECNPTPVPISPDGSYHDSCGDPMLACKPTPGNETTGNCQWRGCANSDFIRNWNTALAAFPQRCNSSTSYCPDNGLGCLPLLPLGGACESVRDDECAGQQSMCLNYICTSKTAGINSGCGIEKIEFRYNYKTSGDAITQTIERDNCTTGLYCSNTGTGFTCIPGLQLGANCTQDRQCQTASCSNNGGANSNGRCIQPTDSFRDVKPYVYVIIGAAVLAFMFLVLSGLWFLHRVQSNRERDKIARFFEIQEKHQLNIDSGEQDEDKLHAMQSKTGGKILLTSPKVQIRGSEAYKRSPAGTRSSSPLPESLASSSKARPDDAGSSSSAIHATNKSTNRSEISRGSIRRKPSDIIPGTAIRYGHREQILYATAMEQYEQEQHQQQQQGHKIPYLNVPRLSIGGTPRPE